ncbi:MAG: SOS response-associated peptidase [Pseudomonadota bacterium]
MCGRFNVSSTPGLQALMDSLGLSIDLPPPRFNIAPTESVGLLARFSDVVEVRSARWWLTPAWSKGPDTKYAMFNARCEGLKKSPAFRKPFASQRGIVPMSSFIEWRAGEGGKQPWLITNEASALSVAALWDFWRPPGSNNQESLLSCTLVTTAAANPFEPWHKRMPVMLTPDEAASWLAPGTIESDSALFDPRLKENLYLYPVDRAVGNSRIKDSNGMDPVGDTVLLKAEDVSSPAERQGERQVE